MYDNELYLLIDNLFSIFGLVALIISYIWLTYHYELKALKVDGYIDLRLEEKKLSTPKQIALKKQVYDLKMLKVKTDLEKHKINKQRKEEK